MYVQKPDGTCMSGDEFQQLLESHFYNEDGTKKENPEPLKLKDLGLKTVLSKKVPDIIDIPTEQ